MTNQSCILTRKPNDFFSFNSEDSSLLFRYHNKVMKRGDWAKNISLPISVFNNYSLSALEAITKYIKEEIGLSYKQIASILNRDERTIWGAYNYSKKKMQERFLLTYSKFYIPLPIFKERSLSVLETIIEYLKEELNLRYCQIAALLNRDDRTIWTVYNRAKKKRRRIRYEKILS